VEVKRGKTRWFQVRHGDNELDWLSIAGVERVLAEAGIDLGDLERASIDEDGPPVDNRAREPHEPLPWRDADDQRRADWPTVSPSAPPSIAGVAERAAPPDGDVDGDLGVISADRPGPGALGDGVPAMFPGTPIDAWIRPD
jgi:hypothetical protein